MSLPEFLQDKRFLRQLDLLPIKQQFVKVTVLNWNEHPLQEIQGIAKSGSVNLDGNSAMRRTATLSLFAEQKQNNLANVDHLFSINKKCKLEIGIVNTLPIYKHMIKDLNGKVSIEVINYQEKYGNIVWFPLGIFIMFNPSIAHGMDGVTISMQLKDKMCLLNGDLGGQIHSSVDFAKKEIGEDPATKQPIYEYTLIYDIIKQLVNHWGNEQLSKIVISEVPLRIKRAVKWKGSQIVYLRKITDSLDPDYKPGFWTLTRQAPEEEDLPKIIYYPINPEDIMGFQYVDFTFPGNELTCGAGQTVTAVLDKVIGVLGNYEYFYDVEGNFIFREKQNYLNMSNTAYWLKEHDQRDTLPSDIYAADYYRLSKSIYSFEYNEITTAYNNTLNYNNIKNDFVVWGLRNTSVNNQKIPCRYHLAIDKKPRKIRTQDGKEQYPLHPWIALYKDDYDVIRGRGYTKQSIPTKVEYPIEAINGKGWEARAEDWRQQIYYQMLEDQVYGTGENTELNNTYFQYYAQLKEQFPKIYDLINHEFKTQSFNPWDWDYYLDFIDEDSQVGQYSVNNIGRRAKVIGDNNEGINCTFEPNIPDIIYVEAGAEHWSDIVEALVEYGQEWTQVSTDYYELMALADNYNSCFEKIKDLLYQHTHVNNTISITTLPIYYLQPNTRITVEDAPAGIQGDFIIQSISLPLDVSSTMTINAYKALQKI